MKTRAAVAYEAGKPLTIEQVDLDGPKLGEVLVEIKASGICHTDEFTRSGADPEGLFPAIFGHEGAGVVVDVATVPDTPFAVVTDTLVTVPLPPAATKEVFVPSL